MSVGNVKELEFGPGLACLVTGRLGDISKTVKDGTTLIVAK